jgi:hypothetical protein
MELLITDEMVLLEAVARERLEETQAEKVLSGCCGDL